jgi:hypothetical protein
MGLIALTGCGGSHSATSATQSYNPTGSTTTAAPTLSSSGPASTLPAPSKADGKFLESVVLGSTTECLSIANAQIAGGAEHTNEAQTARTALTTRVDELIARFHRVNPDATIPYGEGRHVTTRQDVSGTIEELNKKPAAPAGAPACAPELAERLSQGTGIK